MTPEDLDIMKRDGKLRPGFLERRGAKIFAPYRALITYDTLTLLVTQNPSAMYDYYIVQSFHKTFGTFKHVLLNLQIPKIPDKYRAGFFDTFGEEIPNEKKRRSAES